MTRSRTWWPVLPALLLMTTLTPATLPASMESLERHVVRLASDDLEGRLTGSGGARQAVDYLAAQLNEIGAEPLPGQDDFLMPFEFTAGRP